MAQLLKIIQILDTYPLYKNVNKKYTGNVLCFCPVEMSVGFAQAAKNQISGSKEVGISNISFRSGRKAMHGKHISNENFNLFN